MSALAGLLVLEYSREVAGAYCGKLFATFGARVIKLEPPGGDGLRKRGPYAGDGAVESPASLAFNGGKQSLTIELGREEGRALALRLASRADVFVTDHGLAAMEGLGLGYEALAAANPGLVYVSLSPLGDSGPYAGFAASDLTVYALGGYSFITGYPEGEPMQGPPGMPGCMCGANGYTGALAALWVRRRTGRGQLVEVSEVESLAAAHQWTISRYSYNGRIQRRNGNRYDSVHPVTLYRCLDGWIATGAATDDQFERLAVVVERLDLLDDGRFKGVAARVANAAALDAELEPWFARHARDQASRLCQELRVPFAPVLDMREVLDHEHLRARAFWTRVEHPVVGPIDLPGPPYRLPRSPARVGRAPLPGEHTVAIAAEFAAEAVR